MKVETSTVQYLKQEKKIALAWRKAQQMVFSDAEKGQIDCASHIFMSPYLSRDNSPLQDRVY